MSYSDRYVYDPLYGKIRLPNYIWDLYSVPELQRLREIRLCNINSLCLTGGANINRFEHAIGTCYLALKCTDAWLLKAEISEKDKMILLIAALFHDVLNFPFGHTFEYIEESRKYRPEEDFSTLVLGTVADYQYKNFNMETIFHGNYGKLKDVLQGLDLSKRDIEQIGRLINGSDKYGALISNSMDLDNIDNVFRLAFHIGLVEDKSVPLKLAENLTVENAKLRIEPEGIDLVNIWHKTRKKLYELLLLNPDEFSGKCMLTEAIENARSYKEIPFKWFYTDSEILDALRILSHDNQVIIDRLYTGDLYGCLSIYSTDSIAIYNTHVSKMDRVKIENDLTKIVRQDSAQFYGQAEMAIHFIKDVNKTERKIDITTTKNESVTIGVSSNRILIGVFCKNKSLNMRAFQCGKVKVTTAVIELVRRYLAELFNDDKIEKIELYEEVAGK